MAERAWRACLVDLADLTRLAGSGRPVGAVAWLAWRLVGLAGAWSGLAWPGLAWPGPAWPGLALPDSAWPSLAGPDPASLVGPGMVSLASVAGVAGLSWAG